ncbi:hypothetical protein FRACYDRAFT_200782 [Fragilariopsis cylindrus CCMP1102]|uniref:Uncharacterized protein n=1 Tax=Fragilariopsis cylindrus CCMP1102 TaxID=635003 RepID=A0A1E7EKR8_9STRA|nr:hypothetical protein FRACYDRAFT_200782 [Fragilariopsis cylindrus CCMP1102]|eukprot:OEU06447.1 hypothetical protein FRACYDRAFT_200782 [Fragilariopsis cylindrus CCMP1102]
MYCSSSSVVRPKVFRPDLDDVERLSYGKGAKKQRGTGSKYHCHRLNQEERKLFELAKKKSCGNSNSSGNSFYSSFLTVRGNGYRKNRKGSPLHNIFRQRCDALEELCVIVEKRNSGSSGSADGDRLMIDFSTLRVRNDTKFLSMILENVLKAKYPDLYHNLLMMKHEEEVDEKCDRVVGTAGDALIRTPIDWETVKTKPIWAVNERLLIVPCDRDIAKELAIDILKESSNFVFDDSAYTEVIIEEQKSLPRHDDDDAVLTTSKNTGSSSTTNDDNSIDWDDI